MLANTQIEPSYAMIMACANLPTFAKDQIEVSSTVHKSHFFSEAVQIDEYCSLEGSNVYELARLEQWLFDNLYML